MTGNGRNTPECRELIQDELDDVSGGVVCITHPPNPCKAVERVRQLTLDELDAVSGGYQNGASNPSGQKAEGTAGASCCTGKHCSEIIVVC